MATFTNEGRLNMDDRPPGWVLEIPSRNGALGQTVRLPAAPPADRASETWPRAQKFGGAPTPLFIVRSVASPSWSVERGFSLLPAELAALLIRGGHARPAHLDEMPKHEYEEGEFRS
jgi:hypothetical protein